MKVKLKMRISALIIICLIFSMILPGGVVLAEQPEEYAKLHIDEVMQLDNMRVSVTEDYVEKGGKRGIKYSRTNHYVWIDVSSKVAYDLPEYTAVEITAEYFDEGNGFITFAYDSHNPSGTFGVGDKVYKAGDLVHLGDSKEWKSYTWYLEDAKFTDRCIAYDFRIGIWDPNAGFSPEDVVIGDVTVRRVEPRNPLSTNGLAPAEKEKNTGNIFSAEDEVKLVLPMKNKTDKLVNAEFDITVKDNAGHIVETKKITDSYEPGVLQNTNVQLNNPGVRAIYDVEIKVKSSYDGESEKVYEETYLSQFSISYMPGPDNKNPYYGACQQMVGYGWGDIETTPYLMRNLGLSYIRDELPWAEVEVQKGVLKIPEGRKEMYQKVKDLGIDPVLILFKTNPNYDNNGTPSSDEAIKAYANYCAYMASEFKGIIKYYEIWNEYNIAAFNPTNEPPETYAKMLKAAYKAIKEVNPEAVVIGLDIAGIGTDWPRRVFEAGGYDYCDAVSVHPYDWSGEFKEGDLIRDANAFKALMREYGEEKPLWFTEIGFSTYVGGNGKGYTREEQAAATVLMRAISTAYDLCDVTLQYCFHDQDSDSASESCWGFVNSWADRDDVRGGAKENYLAAGAMNHFWGNAEYKGKIVDEENRQYAFNFYNRNLDKNVLLLEAGKGSSLKTLDLGCSSVDIYDMYGNYVRTLNSENGIYSFQIKEIPVYAIGNFGKFEETTEKPPIEIDSDSKRVAAGETVVYTFNKNTDKDFDVKVISGESLKVIDNNGFSGNTARVVIQTPSDMLDEFKFSVVFTDKDGKIYQSIEPSVTTTHPVDITITSEQATDKGNNHWRARAVVENLTKTQNISGKLSVAEPYDVAEISEEKTITTLAPGEKITFLFNLPERVNKKPIELKLKATLDGGYVREVTQLLDFTLCYYTDKKPVIDGEISLGEWTGSWIGTDEAKDVRENPNWAGPEDLSFSGTMMWDDENFYMMAIVTDDVMCVKYNPPNAENMWRGDMVQFGIDDRTVFNSAEVGRFCEIGLANMETAGPTAYRFLTYYEKPVSTVVENCELAIKRYDTYTVYEFAIPFSEMFYDNYKVDTERPYRFSILANDNDTGSRKGWIEYTSGIGASKNVELFGSLRFVR